MRRLFLVVLSIAVFCLTFGSAYGIDVDIGPDVIIMTPPLLRASDIRSRWPQPSADAL